MSTTEKPERKLAVLLGLALKPTSTNKIGLETCLPIMSHLPMYVLKSADDSSSKYKIKLKTKCYHQPKTRSYDDEVDGLSGIDVGNPAITFNPV